MYCPDRRDAATRGESFCYDLVDGLRMQAQTEARKQGDSKLEHNYRAIIGDGDTKKRTASATPPSFAEASC